MSSEITVPPVVRVVEALRVYLVHRRFYSEDAKLHRFDGHAMMRLLKGVESTSLELMQQRVAFVLAGLELGYQFEGAPLKPHKASACDWTRADTARLVGTMSPLPAYVGRYVRLFERNSV